MNLKHLESAHQRDAAKARELIPLLDALKGVEGFRHEVKRDKDGRILKQRYKYKANENGKLTREAKIVQSMMQDYWRASTATEAKHRGFPGEYCGKVTGKRQTREASEPIACPTCGFNRFMGRCTCEH